MVPAILSTLKQLLSAQSKPTASSSDGSLNSEQPTPENSAGSEMRTGQGDWLAIRIFLLMEMGEYLLDSFNFQKHKFQILVMQ